MTIDRQTLVRRHNPVFTTPHPVNVLTVGNGDFAATVDLSGLQTFAQFHELRPDPDRPANDGSEGLPEQRRRAFDRDDFQIPLRTQSSWGWYRTRGERDYSFEESLTAYPTPRGPVEYPDRIGLQRPTDPIPDVSHASAWLAFNPRRLHLGRLSLDVSGALQPLVNPDQLTDARTELDLWTGTVTADYLLEGARVRVETAVDPAHGTIAVKVTSALLRRGLAVSWMADDQADDLAAFELPVRHGVRWDREGANRWKGERTVETSHYAVEILASGTGEMLENGDRLRFTSGEETLEVVVSLSDEGSENRPAPPAREVFAAASMWWHDFWMRGAAVSFDRSTSPHAIELERRVILSQYLTAVNSAGSTPPQETGLTYNTWTGKFHLEMHWWHAAHFALWKRGDLLERSLGWYTSVLPAARETAARQGYAGARWPKQTDLSGRESPSHVGAFIIWQQPHLIHLLELLRCEGRPGEFDREHLPLIQATAEFMADFVQDNSGTFELPPPLVPAQESYVVDRRTTANPTFELAYWAWGLRVANDWRERVGLARERRWDEVSEGMAPPLVLSDGTYAAVATPPYLIRKDHPSMLMALGWLPSGPLIDQEVMRATLHSVWAQWDLQTTWGWDYPVLAMTAAKLGDAGLALSALTLESPKNVYLPNGHNPQMPGFLSLYLPANGGLLAAVAHLVAAIDEGATLPPGWHLDAEGFSTGEVLR